MTNLQKVIQDKTKEVLTQKFSKYVEVNIGEFDFDPISWRPNWDRVNEDVMTSKEVIQASDEFVKEHAKTILAEVKKEEREYQENN